MPGLRLSQILLSDLEQQAAAQRAHSQQVQAEADAWRLEALRLRQRLDTMAHLLHDAKAEARHARNGQPHPAPTTARQPLTARGAPAASTTRHADHLPLISGAQTARGSSSSCSSVFDANAFSDSIASLQLSNRQLLGGARPATGAQPHTPGGTPHASEPTKAAMLNAWLQTGATGAPWPPTPAAAAPSISTGPTDAHPSQPHAPPTLPAASLAEVRDAVAALQFEFDLERIWGRLAEVARLLARCERVAVYVVRRQLLCLCQSADSFAFIVACIPLLHS